MNSILPPLLLGQVAASPCLVPRVSNRVCAGFPSPAEDLGAERIDLTRELIAHPEATFLVRVKGESMRDAGILDGDVLIVDRALKPQNSMVVVAVVDGEFTVKTFRTSAGRFRLQAANPAYPDIVPHAGQVVEIWGVVTAAIHQFPV